MKRNFIIVGILVVIGIASGYYFLRVPSEVKACNTKIEENWDQGVSCVHELAQNLDSARYCSKLRNATAPGASTETDFRTICTMGVALHVRDAGVCKGIRSATDDATEESRNVCISNIAVSSKNADLCSSVSERKGGREVSDRDICLSRTAKSPEECESIKSQVPRAQCLGVFARSSEDVALCGKIREESEELASLKSSCIVDIAGKTGALDACDSIGNEKVREQCKVGIIISAKMDSSNCSRTGSLVDQCRRALAQ